MTKYVEFAMYKKNKRALNTTFSPFDEYVTPFDADANYLHTWRREYPHTYENFS